MATMTGFDKSTKILSLDDYHNDVYDVDDRIELGTLDKSSDVLAFRTFEYGVHAHVNLSLEDAKVLAMAILDRVNSIKPDALHDKVHLEQPKEIEDGSDYV